jgi:hypothetical protein
MALENQQTAFLRAEEWKTCKRITAGRNWHRFRAGQRGSDAFVSIDSQKNLKSPFLYRKVLFMLRIGERRVSYTFWSDHVAF